MSVASILKYVLKNCVVSRKESHQVVAKRRWIICISQVSLSLLHSLHAAVDGPHQRLLGQTLTITNSRVT